MKIISTITKDEPVTDDKPKSKKVRIKSGKETKGQYGIYSGVIDDNGKPLDNPTDIQAVKTMVNYMKNNKSDQSDSPSNVYRLPFSHLAINYKKKNQNIT